MPIDTGTRMRKTPLDFRGTMVARSENPLARLHALWTLEGLEALRDEEILRA